MFSEKTGTEHTVESLLEQRKQLLYWLGFALIHVKERPNSMCLMRPSKEDAEQRDLISWRQAVIDDLEGVGIKVDRDQAFQIEDEPKPREFDHDELSVFRMRSEFEFDMVARSVDEAVELAELMGIHDEFIDYTYMPEYAEVEGVVRDRDGLIGRGDRRCVVDASAEWGRRYFTVDEIFPETKEVVK